MLRNNLTLAMTMIGTTTKTTKTASKIAAVRVNISSLLFRVEELLLRVRSINRPVLLRKNQSRSASGRERLRDGNPAKSV
jgi:hypothetical protein